MALAAWLMLLAVAVAWGHALLPAGTLNVHAPPFQGHYRFLPRAVVPGASLAALGVVFLPWAAQRLPWRVLPVTGAGAAAAWAVGLAVWDGHQSLGGPLGRAHEYLPAVPTVGDDPAGFLAGFADAVAHRELPVHVNGHPPLMVLVFWALDRLGATGPGWAGALVIAVGSSAVAAVLVTVRALGDEAAARRALPFLVLAPFAVTVATSADAFFLGVGAWAAAALAVALRRRSWRASRRRRPARRRVAVSQLRPAALRCGAARRRLAGRAPARAAGRAARRGGACARARSWDSPSYRWRSWHAGFSWFDGVHATHRAWELGKGDDRPYLYSLVADVAVLGVLVGPATAASITRRPGRVPSVLAASSALGLLLLAVSGVTRLEVERIWLPFAPWLVLLTAGIPARGRGWLAVNAACALTFQLLVLDVW